MSRHLYRFIVSAVFLLAFILPSVASLAQQEADVTCDSSVNYQRRAQSSMDEGSYDSAVEAYSCILQADPTTFDAYYGRANARILASAIDHAPYSLDSSVDYAIVANYAPDLITQGIAHYTSDIAATPDEVAPLALRAFTYSLIGQFEQAINDYDRIIELDPDNGFAYLGRGVDNLYLGNTRGVEVDLARAVDLDPNNASVYQSIGSAYAAADEVDKALDAYNLAVEADPENPQVYAGRAGIYDQSEDYDKAIEDYSQSITLSPDNYITLYRRGLDYLNLNQYDTAIEDFNQAIHINDHSAFIFLGRASAQEALGNGDNAALDYLSYVQLMASQPRRGDALEAGTPVTVPMVRGAAYVLPFEAQEGQVFDINASSETGEVDPLIIVLDPDGKPLAGNDDIDAENENFNAQISGFSAPSDGTYFLIVTHAGGGSDGDVTVTLDVGGQMF